MLWLFLPFIFSMGWLPELLWNEIKLSILNRPQNHREVKLIYTKMVKLFWRQKPQKTQVFPPNKSQALFFSIIVTDQNIKNFFHFNYLCVNDSHESCAAMGSKRMHILNILYVCIKVTDVRSAKKPEKEYLLAAVTGCTARIECSIQYSCCPVCGNMHCSVPLPSGAEYCWQRVASSLKLHRLLEQLV